MEGVSCCTGTPHVQGSVWVACMLQLPSSAQVGKDARAQGLTGLLMLL